MNKYGGIDIGGSSIKFGIVSNGKVESKKSFPYSGRRSQIVQHDLRAAVRELIENKVKGIGIGFPGYIDQENKRFIGGPNMEIAINVKEMMEQEDFHNYKIDNDGNLAALAEYEYFYSGRVENFIFISFGTGIGGGVINNSKLIRGEGNAGELGHILISNDPNLETCGCGKVGCFESLASASQWTRAVTELLEIEDLISSRARLKWRRPPKSELYLFNKANYKQIDKGSSLFNKNLSLTKLQIKKRDEFISYISRGLISLYEIFDNQIFVIGGSFTEDDSDLIELLNERIKLQEIADRGGRGFPEINIAQLKSDAGIIGATCLFND